MHYWLFPSTSSAIVHWMKWDKKKYIQKTGQK
jgi:hypothetical protein